MEGTHLSLITTGTMYGGGAKALCILNFGNGWRRVVRLTPRLSLPQQKMLSVPRWIGCRVGPKLGLETVEIRRNFCLCRESKAIIQKFIYFQHDGRSVLAIIQVSALQNTSLYLHSNLSTTNSSHTNRRLLAF